jgi:hypothetical protein
MSGAHRQKLSAVVRRVVEPTAQVLVESRTGRPCTYGENTSSEAVNHPEAILSILQNLKLHF